MKIKYFSSCPFISSLTLPYFIQIEVSNIYPFLFTDQSVNWITQSCLTLRPHGLQHSRPPCPSPTAGVYSNSCSLSWWCHPTVSSSVIPFSSRLQSDGRLLIFIAGRSYGKKKITSTFVCLRKSNSLSLLKWFSGWRRLNWSHYFFYINTLNISFNTLPAYMVSEENSDIILIFIIL